MSSMKKRNANVSSPRASSVLSVKIEPGWNSGATRNKVGEGSSNLLPTTKMIYSCRETDWKRWSTCSPAPHGHIFKGKFRCPDRETIEQENYYCLSRLKSLLAFLYWLKCKQSAAIILTFTFSFIILLSYNVLFQQYIYIYKYNFVFFQIALI